LGGSGVRVWKGFSQALHPSAKAMAATPRGLGMIPFTATITSFLNMFSPSAANRFLGRQLMAFVNIGFVKILFKRYFKIF
jgi:hypothetical protein